MCCLEGLLPESGFLGHHYSVLKERRRASPCGGPGLSLLRVRRRSVTAPRRDPQRSSITHQLLENCIASTSILKIPSYKEPTVDALAPDADEGRGWLR